MSAPPTPAKSTAPRESAPRDSARGRWRAALEVLLILALFFLYAGSPAPNVNEAHYLAKAKHFWNPAWAQGDIFLESADAHLTFNVVFGWLTLLLPLEATAWVGRLITWTLLAWSWRRLSAASIDVPFAAVLSAGMMVVLLHYFHMAGEWMIGGVEAKGFAFVGLLLGLEAMVRGRWRLVWLCFGGAAAFHVLVGGWAVVAASGCYLLSWQKRPGPLSQLLPLAGGLALALPGVLPALLLTWGQEGEVVERATAIYVFERLPHHLVPTEFAGLAVARFLAISLGWAVVAVVDRRDERQARLSRFVAAALAIATAGLLVDLLLLDWPELQAWLLRLYWFRLSDVAVPLGLSLGAVGLAARLGRQRRAAGWATAAGGVIASGLGIGLVAWDAHSDPRPPADRQTLAHSRDNPETTHEIYRDWRRVCHWISTHTEPDAIFITPPLSQQTFKWYAGRAEAVNRKDLPQDAASILQWRRRIVEVTGELETDSAEKPGLARLTDVELAYYGRKYGARYVLVDRTRSRVRPGFHLVYPRPNSVYKNEHYAVYLLPPAEDVKRESDP